MNAAPNSHGYISHFSEPKAAILSSSEFDTTRFAGRSATHVFPVGHFSPNPGTGFMHLMRSVPLSATATRQEYDVYRLHTPHATPEAHARMAAFYRKVVDEDFALCENVQRNLSRGVFERGPLHPFHEEGVFAFQTMLLRVLREHVLKESGAGHEIWPARPKNQTFGAEGGPVSGAPAAVDGESNDASICEILLACNGDKRRDLQW